MLGAQEVSLDSVLVCERFPVRPRRHTNALTTWMNLASLRVERQPHTRSAQPPIKTIHGIITGQLAAKEIELARVCGLSGHQVFAGSGAGPFSCKASRSG